MTDVECPAGHNSLRHSCCAYLREARAKVNRLENELVTANLRASAAEILLAEARRRVGKLEKALRIIEAAIADGDGGSYWPARKFLDERDIYNDDLNEERVLGAVAKAALTKEPG